MKPCLKIKREILLAAAQEPDLGIAGPFDTEEQIEAAWERLDELDARDEYESEFRDSGVDTGLPCPSSRHYESRSVARKLSDGSWVGWVFWFGGGKHGEPEAVDWMGEAYDLECREEEKLMTVRTFTRKE